MLMVSIMGDILEAAILTPSSWEPKKKKEKGISILRKVAR